MDNFPWVVLRESRAVHKPAPCDVPVGQPNPVLQHGRRRDASADAQDRWAGENRVGDSDGGGQRAAAMADQLSLRVGSHRCGCDVLRCKHLVRVNLV